MTYTDWLGQVISEGDMVVYPGRQSSSLWMNLGRVKAIFPKTIQVLTRDRYSNKMRVSTLRSLDRLTRVSSDITFDSQRCS